MSRARHLFRRLIATLRGARADRQLSRELESHLLLMQDDFERRGMTRDEARLAARRAFGACTLQTNRQSLARATASAASTKPCASTSVSERKAPES